MNTWTDEALDRAAAAQNPVPLDQLADSADWPESLALLAQVLADNGDDARPVRLNVGRRRTRVVAAVAAAALVVAAAVTVSQRGTANTAGKSARSQHHNTLPDMSLVDFTTQTNNDIVARITDPDAAAGQLDAVFAAHHLDISVTVLPVSPSLVGTIVYDDGSDFQPIHAGSCLAGGTQCTVGFVIPANFTGHADIAVGRVAKPGEIYESSDSSFGAGEVLHCAGVFNQPVSIAAPIVAMKGLTVQWQDGSSSTKLSTAPAGDYVVGGTPISSTTVMLMLQPTPLVADTPDLVEANSGC